MRKHQENDLARLEERLSSEKLSEVKGRKFNGFPYLKFKKTKVSPRQKIRQLLHSTVPVSEFRWDAKEEKTEQL